jgi:hypothetical protein
MFFRVLTCAAGALLTAGLAAGPTLAATAIRGAVSLNAQATVGTGPTAADPHTRGFIIDPHDISTASSATASGGRDSVTASGAISAHWDSGNSGLVTTDRYGWTFAAGDPDIHALSASLASDPDGAPDWTYEFTATGDGSFDLTADVFGAGTDVFGLGEWDVKVAEGGSSAETVLLRRLDEAPRREVSASFSQALLAGHTYTVSLINFDSRGDFGVTTGSTLTGEESGTFKWGITEAAPAVPEPANWALMIMGFGGVGVMLRAKRSDRLSWLRAGPVWSVK